VGNKENLSLNDIYAYRLWMVDAFKAQFTHER